MFIPAFTTKAMTSEFPLSISLGWVVMFLDSHREVFTFLSWIDLQVVARTFLISILNTQITSKLLTQGYRYHKLRKTFESSSGHTLSFYLSLVKIVPRICYWRNLSTGPLRWFSLQTKEGQMLQANFVSSGSKIVKCFLSRKYDPVIIEDDMSCVWPFYSFAQIFT